MDVNFGGGSGDWHTLAVGGLGKGGHSYYALDVTDPAAVTDETTAAKQYLWTWTDADMGYTYGQGFIAKTRARISSSPRSVNSPRSECGGPDRGSSYQPFGIARIIAGL